MFHSKIHEGQRDKKSLRKQDEKEPEKAGHRVEGSDH